MNIYTEMSKTRKQIKFMEKNTDKYNELSGTFNIDNMINLVKVYENEQRMLILLIKDIRDLLGMKDSRDVLGLIIHDNTLTQEQIKYFKKKVKEYNKQLEEYNKKLEQIKAPLKDIEQKKNSKETDYNNIIQKIKEKNNDSVYINTNIRNPQLQNEYRKAIIQRFNKCIISDYDSEVCEAAHIVPFSESENFEIDNGLLLNCVLHNLFDKYYWSINPDTFCIEIFKPDTSNIYSILKEYDNKYIEILKEYPKIKEYLKNHYDKSVYAFNCSSTI